MHAHTLEPFENVEAAVGRRVARCERHRRRERIPTRENDDAGQPCDARDGLLVGRELRDGAGHVDQAAHRGRRHRMEHEDGFRCIRIGVGVAVRRLNEEHARPAARNDAGRLDADTNVRRSDAGPLDVVDCQRNGRGVHHQEDPGFGFASLRVSNPRRQRVHVAGRAERDGRLKREAVVSGDRVPVGSIVEEHLRRGAADRRQVGRYCQACACRVRSREHINGQEDRVACREKRWERGPHTRRRFRAGLGAAVALKERGGDRQREKREPT